MLYARLMLLLALPFIWGCKDRPTISTASNAKAAAKKLQVVCTTGMIADLVRRIGGTHLEVVQLMKAGVDPHLYKASPGDMQLLNGAGIIFFSGQHLEGKMADLLTGLGKSRRCVAVTDKIPENLLLKTEDGIVDPHLWFDVTLWKLAALRICEVLCEVDPNFAEGYQLAAASLDVDLTRLHDYVKTQLMSIDKSRRVLVTAHDAFQYFGKAYDIEVRSIQGISTESEASVKQVNDLVNYIVSRKIKAVFVESSVSEKNIKALVEGCKAQGHKVEIGGELYSDAPGPDGTPDATYIGMVRHNVDTIVKALK